VARLSDWVLRHRLLIAAFWVLIAVAGAVSSPTTIDRLGYEFALPGQPAYETNQRILAEFGNGDGEDPLLLTAEGDDAAAAVTRAAAQVTGAVDGTRVVTPEVSDVLAAGSSAVAVVYPPVTPGQEPYAAAIPAIEEVLAQAPADGPQVRLTGFGLLADGGEESGDRGVLAEVLLGAGGALVVLLLVFGSLLAGVPLLVAACAILGTFLALLGLTALTDVVFVVQYLVALIGLGVAIDYSLLLVTRWREELVGGADNDRAVRTAMATAGRSVLFSGLTVAISLAALVLVPLPFLRSVGFAGLLIPLFSVATVLTLVPGVLSAWGPRLLWPRGRRARARSPFWTRVARAVVARRWPTIAITTVALVLLALPALGISLGSPQLTGVSSSSPESRSLTAAVDAGVPVGVVRPVEVLVTGDPGAAADTEEELAAVEGVAGAVAPDDDGWRSGDLRLVQVYLADDPASDAGRATLERVREATPDGAAVGGTAAEDVDFVEAVYGDAGWVVLAIVVITFLALARALRSFWLPVKALVLNVISIAAAYGITVLVWQDGWGSELLFGQEATGAVTTWAPIAAFAFLFGLSMDYEVFILARMREAYDEHGRTDDAVVDGIAHTGRLVSSAALILFFSFVALATVPSIDVKIVATTLAVGILLDAVVVRGLLAPALVAVLGRANWTLPRPLASVLRVPADDHE
jgi:RND superfamily putative drug exporter